MLCVPGRLSPDPCSFPVPQIQSHRNSSRLNPPRCSVQSAREFRCSHLRELPVVLIDLIDGECALIICGRCHRIHEFRPGVHHGRCSRRWRICHLFPGSVWEKCWCCRRRRSRSTRRRRCTRRRCAGAGCYATTIPKHDHDQRNEKEPGRRMSAYLLRWGNMLYSRRVPTKLAVKMARLSASVGLCHGIFESWPERQKRKTGSSVSRCCSGFPQHQSTAQRQTLLTNHAEQQAAARPNIDPR